MDIRLNAGTVDRVAEFTVHVETALAAGAEAVWTHAASMEGVNEELGPWLRMTVPREARGLRIDAAPVGEEAFTSTLLAFGLIPFDRHHLKLDAIHPLGFEEESWSWMQRRWRHVRTITPTSDNACTVTDHLTIRPRLAPAFLARPIVQALFKARHRKLKARFGTT